VVNEVSFSIAGKVHVLSMAGYRGMANKVSCSIDGKGHIVNKTIFRTAGKGLYQNSQF
jgi:hypothetical protein